MGHNTDGVLLVFLIREARESECHGAAMAQVITGTDLFLQRNKLLKVIHLEMNQLGNASFVITTTITGSATSHARPKPPPDIHLHRNYVVFLWELAERRLQRTCAQMRR